MVYRTVICVLFVAVVGVGLACSLVGQPDSGDAPPHRSTTGAIPPTAQSAPAPYYGPTSIEERILSSVAVVRARLTNIGTEVVTTTTEQWNEDYYVAIKFHLSVREYLYGSGADTIIAYWVSHGRFSTAEEAENLTEEYFLSRRDAQWDNRDAVLFLGDGSNETFPAIAQPPNIYLLAVGGPIRGDNSHFLDDKYDRRWLPAASATTTTSASQKFLLEQPVEGSTPSTITLGDLKARIAAIVAEINAGDGSENYKQCLLNKYALKRLERVRMSGSGPSAQYRNFEPRWDGAFTSGQPAGAKLYEYEDRGLIEIVNGAEEKTKLWLDGHNAALFSVKEMNHRPVTHSPNKTRFDFSVVSVRPIPAGTYEFNHNYGTHIDCGNTSTFALTANVTAPDGVLHELFFDPVTVGSAVKADATNGVLKPASFTDTNVGPATLSSISYEPSSTGSGQAGTVKIEVTPDDALDDYFVDIIELDGTVSLSLDVADARVDGASGTLSWTVASEPWEDGDMLMVRIRGASP